MSVSDTQTAHSARRTSTWSTLADGKKILIVVHTEVYGKRLQDLLVLLESDLRLEVTFTIAPHPFNAGADQFLRSLGATVVEWQEAVSNTFDLALAAGSQGIEQLNAPLVRISHGAGHLKLARREDSPTGEARSPGGITGRGYLTWEGRVVPAAVALPHRDDLRTLERWCPEALPIASVTGDPCYDRILASLPLKQRYRDALGLSSGQKLVLVTSTWGETSSFNRIGALLPRLLAELPREEFKVALLIHPNVWSRYGAWQVRAWLAGCRDAGFAVLPPQEDWRPMLVAADWIIGDYGSVTLYGTLTGTPVLMTHFPFRDANPVSAGVELALSAPALSPAQPLPAQLDYASTEFSPDQHARIAARISSEPGRFNRNFGRLLYRVLGLGQQACPPAAHPVSLPPPWEELTRTARPFARGA
ncbi:hypothetical protein [Streptomyces albus]|uniref:hypothetical protein n=1 Tax=Streptomyces albus TaxID=1888 RepID=UPI0006E2EFAE|nr:hypothetical protein [Streptomyces albus]